jgi:hypothetical protein
MPEIVAKAKPANVEIVATDATGALTKTLGTGFFVSPDGLALRVVVYCYWGIF